MNTNSHSLIHMKNANKLPYKHKFYILAYMLLNLQPIIRKFCFYTCKDFDLIFLLIFTIEPHLNTPAYFHFTLSRRIYTHIQTKRVRHYRQAFICLSIKSYKRAFHTHLRICISTCLQKDVECTLQACNYSCVHTFRLNRHKTSMICLYNLQTS